MSYLYINMLQLLNTAVENNILAEKDGKIFVFRNSDDDDNDDDDGYWSLSDKDLIAKELMKDIDGQEIIKKALKEKGVEFNPVL